VTAEIVVVEEAEEMVDEGEEEEEEEHTGDEEVDIIRMEREQMIVDVIETQKKNSAKMEHRKLQ